MKTYLILIISILAISTYAQIGKAKDEVDKIFGDSKKIGKSVGGLVVFEYKLPKVTPQLKLEVSFLDSKAEAISILEINEHPLPINKTQELLEKTIEGEWKYIKEFRRWIYLDNGKTKASANYESGRIDILTPKLLKWFLKNEDEIKKSMNPKRAIPKKTKLQENYTHRLRHKNEEFDYKKDQKTLRYILGGILAFIVGYFAMRKSKKKSANEEISE